MCTCSPVSLREVKLGEVGGDEDVGVVLPQQPPSLETQPELGYQFVREVIEGPEEVHEVGGAEVFVEEVLVPEAVRVGDDVVQAELLQ